MRSSSACCWRWGGERLRREKTIASQICLFPVGDSISVTFCRQVFCFSTGGVSSLDEEHSDK